MIYKRKNSFTSITIHKITCICFALVFVNFLVQFNNYFIAKIISVTKAANQNAIGNNFNINFTSNNNTSEEHNEEAETNNKNNTNKKTEYFYNHNNLCYISSFNSIKNHFVMVYIDEVSLEIPSPPPWC
jgi:hypothetical protein